MLRLGILLTVLLLVGLAVLLASRMASRTTSGAPPPAALVRADDAGRELPRTTVTPVLDEAHAADRNLVWCVTFQLAWDQLAGIVGEPPALEADPPLARRLAQQQLPETALDESSYVAVGGFGDGTRARLAERLRRTFDAAAAPRLLPDRLEDDEALAFAWLRVTLPFATPFQPVPAGLRFAGRTVSAFGLWDDGDDELWHERARQVRIWRYGGPEDFVVELRPEDPRERLLVARLAPGGTLAETVETVLSRVGGGASPPDPGDRLVVPRLAFDLTRRYRELSGRRLTNPAYTNHVLVAAAQNVRFRLDEYGAELESESATVVAGAAPAPLPRQMICDGPFLVLLLREGAPAPYFALWIDNDELLLAQPH